jgi:cob(I)alamin adenosyltransferase
MTDLIAHIREVIDQHDKRDGHDDAGISCGCGATHLSDHSSHVARAIVDRLERRLESADNVRKSARDEVRYASALFDQELTILEGAE